MSDASDLAQGAHLESVKIQGFWRSYQFSWHINRKELKAAFLALKFLIPNGTNVRIQICLNNRTAQLHKVSGTELHCSENVGMVSREEHVPFGSICTRDNEQNCRFVIPSEA